MMGSESRRPACELRIVDGGLRIRNRVRLMALFLFVAVLGFVIPARSSTISKSLLRNPNVFPIAVWLQQPGKAAEYKEIGVNLYVGLWKGPSEDQLAALERADMPVICEQNAFALQNLDRRIIAGWMDRDEPDNAQELPGGKGYGPPFSPSDVRKRYDAMRKADPSRPLLLNLGQGVAWDGWYGRGVRTNKPEDYPLYLQACDIASFDIYPVTHKNPAVRGRLEFVGRGVERLRDWTMGRKPVWACIECTHIDNPNVKPTPDQIKSMVWMAIVHGAKGLIYFCHEFKPGFIEAGLLADKETAEAVGRINARIRELAPVLNSPTLDGIVTVDTRNSQTSNSETGPQVDTMVKRAGEALHVFAINMRNTESTCTFTLKHAPAATTTVSDEEAPRRLPLTNGTWTDTFRPYEMHHYRIE